MPLFIRLFWELHGVWGSWFLSRPGIETLCLGAASCPLATRKPRCCFYF